MVPHEFPKKVKYFIIALSMVQYALTAQVVEKSIFS